MSPKAKKILFIALGVAAVAGIAYYFYSQNQANATATLSQPAIAMTGPTTFTFGTALGSTTAPVPMTSGVFTATNVGNVLTVMMNGAAYKTLTLPSTTGTVSW